MRAALPVFAVLVFIPCAAWPQGSPLGPEFRVNTYTTTDQVDPSIAADSAGNFVVVWTHGPGIYSTNVFGQRYASSGAPLGLEFQVNTPLAQPGQSPSVAADSAGNFVVVWEILFLTGQGLRGQRYASSGAPLGPQFAVGSGIYPVRPSVAADSTGDFVVVWEITFPESNISGQRYASSGVPVGSFFRVNSYATGSQSFPAVAADSSGNFVIVWSSNTQDGSGLGIFGQRYASSGAPLGSEFRVNTFTTSTQARPSVATDASGNFVVVWHSAGQDDLFYGVFGQRYASSGTPLGPEFRVNTLTTNNQSRPALSADAAGNFVVTWSSLSQDGSGYGVFGQRYDAAGTPLGGEFRVNTNTPNAQMAPAVAADAAGDFVVVWQSAAQDGSGYGVFGQRYLPILPVELMQFRVQ